MTPETRDRLIALASLSRGGSMRIAPPETGVPIPVDADAPVILSVVDAIAKEFPAGSTVRTFDAKGNELPTQVVD